jgi:WD40 repeat protein
MQEDHDKVREKHKHVEFRGHSGSVNAVSFNQLNDSIFASASNDRSFKVWDTRKPKPMVHTERGKEEVFDCAFSPFGTSEPEVGESSTYLATCNVNEEISFYETRMWKMVKQIKYKSEVSCFTWDKDGTGFFVADSSGSVSVFHGQSLKQPPLIVLNGIHNNTRCESIAFHPSNSYFVTGAHDSLVAFWDMEELLCSGTMSANHF